MTAKELLELPYCSREDIAAVLGISRVTLWRWIKRARRGGLKFPVYRQRIDQRTAKRLFDFICESDE